MTAALSLVKRRVSRIGLIRCPEDSFRTSYHRPARRMSEADFRIAKRSIGNRMRSVLPYLASTMLVAAGYGLYSVNETAGLFAGVAVMLVGFLVML
ncbi:MAG: hypothetical protein PGN34_01955 [Methylobacterium frigidaeris]